MRVNRRRTKILYEIEFEDSRGIENASPAFLFAPTSHSISYKIFVLLFVDSRWNQLFNLWERGGMRQTPLKKCVNPLNFNFPESHRLLGKPLIFSIQNPDL